MMKTNTTKKIFSTLLVAAMTSSVAGGLLTAISKNNFANADAFPTYQETAASNYQFQNTRSGRTWYISQEGATVIEGDVGLSAEKPVDAWTLLSSRAPLPGDLILVAPGNYNIEKPIRMACDGEYNKYIEVRCAEEGQKATFSFYGLPFGSDQRGVQIDGDYWYWTGVDIRGAGDNGMYIGGSHNIIEGCEFYDNRDSGLQLGRSYSEYTDIAQWPNYNLIKNCTSYNNYDNETTGENADGFAAKLTVGYGNIFDGCIAYRNSDDGWDLYAKVDSGNIGAVIMYNCIAFENGFIMESQADFNAKFPKFDKTKTEGYIIDKAIDDPENVASMQAATTKYLTKDGDGNGFKLGGSVMEGDVFMKNCLSFRNRMHGVTDNSNPGVLSIDGVTAYDNGAVVDNNPGSSNYGKIIPLTGKGEDTYGNINMARQTYSYNVISNVLSVNDGTASLGADEYRGAISNSIFSKSKDKAWKVEGTIDGSTYTEAYAKNGKEVTSVKGSIFTAITPGDIGLYKTDAEKGQFSDIHTEWRNADGSINLGDYFKINSQDGLVAGQVIGADLSKTSWEAYPHYTYINATQAADQEDAVMKQAMMTIDLNTNLSATFQDFDLPTRVEGANVKWQSNDAAIEVKTSTKASVSGTKDARAIVNRGAEDKEVILCATLTSTAEGSTKTAQRFFKVIVKANQPTVGEIVMAGLESDSMIIDQYSKFEEPEFNVTNAADYNGKFLSKDSYDVKTTYMYATSKTGHFTQVHHFTSCAEGVYEVTKTISIEGQKPVDITYFIYVASTSADVDFVGAPQVTVNKDGYTISAEMNNVSGKVYSYVSATKVENITADRIVKDGVANDFRGDKINFQYENANSGAYFIYTVVGNSNGEVTSEVYESEVKVQTINTAEEFKTVMTGEISSTTIYTLGADLDFTGVAYAPSEKPFTGLFNGKGHTIKNITVENTAKDAMATVFYKLKGGTIENVKFENINLNAGAKKQVGIVGIVEDGGILYNIAMTNVKVRGGDRAAALVGQVFEGGKVVIDQVSLKNDAAFDIAITNKDAGAIVGLVQTSSAPADGKFEVSITNIQVFSTVIAKTQAGGLVGRYDSSKSNVDYDFYMNALYFDGAVKTTGGNYCGGILGYHQGLGKLTLTNAVSFATLYHNNVLPHDVAEKNSSGIMGGYSAAAGASIWGCYALMVEHNADYRVNENLDTLKILESTWKNSLGLDMTKWTIVKNGDALAAPYVTLNFLAV